MTRIWKTGSTPLPWTAVLTVPTKRQVTRSWSFWMMPLMIKITYMRPSPLRLISKLARPILRSTEPNVRDSIMTRQTAIIVWPWISVTMTAAVSGCLDITLQKIQWTWWSWIRYVSGLWPSVFWTVKSCPWTGPATWEAAKLSATWSHFIKKRIIQRCSVLPCPPMIWRQRDGPVRAVNLVNWLSWHWRTV